ncbi:MAG: DUF4097 family beta strand repeat-containing protein [Atopostipes suicloacalis]|nr:DUF4097 family beta strand repeat-containing protein [Atopostipes suicloacalis]
MDKGERILELVRDGVLSVEEGLDLLENLSEEESQKAQKKNTKEKDTKEKTKESSDDREKSSVDSDKDKKEEKIKEDELEAIANEINRYSAAIDNLNEDLLAVNNQTSMVEERLTRKKENQNEEFDQRKLALEGEVISLNKEIKWISSKKEVENPERIDQLKQELSQVLDELYQLENDKNDEEIESLTLALDDLEEKRKELAQEKNKKMKEMHSLKMRQWSTKAKQFSNTMELPEDWREGANKTIDKASEIIDEGSQSLAGFLRKTMRKTKDTIRDIDWKEMKMDLSMQEKASFSHEWLFEDTTASILDFKNANGNIHFKRSMNDSIKIEAEIKLYEKKEELSPLESLEEKMYLKIDSDQFTFHIPNKKIKADLIVYLPERNYDYLRVHLIKGNLTFDELLANDLYIKITSGDLVFNQLEATMLEVKMTKGNLTLEETHLKDLLVNTTSGDLRIIGAVESSDLNTASGNILVTLSGEELIQLTARSVKGDVKVSLPKELGFEIEAKAALGKVKSRLTASEKSLEDEVESKIYRFFRMSEGKLGQINLQTTKGNILLKDHQKNEGKGETNEKTNEI